MNPGKFEVSEIEGRFVPEARQAAPFHAGGRAAEAEAILSEAVEQPRTVQDSRLLWLMLLELYRLQGRAADFDRLSARYSAMFLDNLSKVIRVLQPSLLVETLLRMRDLDRHAQFAATAHGL